MRLFALYLSVSLLLIGCSPSTEYTINGTIDLDDGQKVLLLGVDDDFQLSPIDTVEVAAGVFSFSGTSIYPEMHYLNFEGVRSLLPLVLEPGLITVEAATDSIQNAKIRGTESNVDIVTFLDGVKSFNSALVEISYELRNAMLRKDSLQTSDLQDQYDEILKKLTEYELSFISDKPTSYVSSLILEQQLSSGQIDTEDAKKLYEKLSDRIQKTKSAKNIQKLLYPPEEDKEFPGVGQSVSPFEAPNPQGDIVALDDVRGELTVIDFWASWCKPCRDQSPALVQMHKTFADKGVAFISVSLDRNASSWTQAIASDNLDWTHVSNLKYWQDPIAKLYNVRSIPELFLIDESGRVLARSHNLKSINSILENATASL
ncbi:MAG: AhpC/TSA family protein [Flavobacteriaceae bacterium]|jgi:thiol-disulfide isomerase/thioredoxin|nr:AhpC/TSA family protein [Flavobacteriaceae bacterium]